MSQSQVRLTGFRYHPAVGGAEQHARRMLREIGQRLEIDVVTLLTGNRTDWLDALIDGARDADENYEVDGRPVRALARWPLSVRRRLRQLAPFYHLPGSPAPTLMGRILEPELAGVAAGTSVIHNVFMGREAFSLGLLLAARRASRRFVFTPLRHARPLGWSSPAFRELYRSADVLVALTENEAGWLQAHGADRARTEVIGIGPLSDPAASEAPARALIAEETIVLFVGQLHAYKGYRAVIAAARSFEQRKDVRFVFIGPDVRGHARDFAAAARNVTYLKTVSDEVRNALFQACTVVCVPSLRESFGGALVDGWACGKPVIGGLAPAAGELVEDGVDGFLVPQDPAVIADRLRRLLDDPVAARQMGQIGRRKVESRYAWSVVAEAHMRIYNRLLS